MKSVLASILIGFGVAVLLFLGNPLGPILFAFGLMGVCYLQADLYTGKAGYYWKDKKANLATILILNLAAGYTFGLLLSYSSPQLIPVALEKIASWDFSMAFFIRSIFCGMIMYICVDIFKRGSYIGILYGVPLFIFCGFQHCIANVIVLGVAHSWSWTLILAIIGNLVGSMIINILSK
jgi:formate/nitrite transporter FocA (FNT family)